MKKILFVIAIIVLSFSAQARTIEISVGYGVGVNFSVPDFDDIKSPISGGSLSGFDEDFSGAVTVSARYYATSRLAIGLTYANSTVKRNIAVGSSEPIARLKNSCNTIMLTGKFNWLQIKSLTFYSQAALGVTVLGKGTLSDVNNEIMNLQPSDFKSKSTFAWQVAPIGVEWNIIPNLAIFGEAGYGTVGIGTFGAKVIF